LSRLKDDDKEFKSLFFKFQKLVGLLVFPLGVGIYCFSDIITKLLLGEQWMEASGFIGLWGLTSAITIVLAHYSSEVYRAKGRPKLSVLAQWLHIIVLWPVILIAVKYGFETLYIARSWVRMELILVNLVIIFFLVRISPWQMLRNVSASVFASVAMLVVAIVLGGHGDTVVWKIISVILCAMVYIAIIMFFPQERRLIKVHLLNRVR
jgi:PST family polysaccharide transporter